MAENKAHSATLARACAHRWLFVGADADAANYQQNLLLCNDKEKSLRDRSLQRGSNCASYTVDVDHWSYKRVRSAGLESCSDSTA